MEECYPMQAKTESGPNKNILLKEILELQRSVDNLTNQNSKTLSKIQQIQHTFQHSLYQAKKIPGKQIAFKKELLLKQIDKLLQEKSMLDRKLHHFTVQQQQKGDYKNNCILRQSTQYSFLRTVWSKFQTDKPSDALDKIQQLNKAVCTFKNNIIGITNRQKTQPSIQQIFNVTQKQFIALKLKYEQINMVNEDLIGIISKKNETISQLRAKYDNQRRENENLRLQQRKYEKDIIKHKLDNAKMDQNIFRLTNQVKDLKKYIERLQQNAKSQQEEAQKSRKNNQQQQASSSPKSQQTDVIYFNPLEKTAFSIRIQQLKQFKVGQQIQTHKTLKQIAHFLQEKTDNQIYYDTIKIPMLPLSQGQKSSTNDEYSQRTFTSKFISKRESSGLKSSNPKTQRKLLTSRNDSVNQESSSFASSRQKKFSRNTSNLNVGQINQSEQGKISQFIANQQQKKQKQKQFFSDYGLQIEVKRPA